jgi:hypothetical protein
MRALCDAHSWLRAHQLLVSKMYAPARFHFLVNLACLIWSAFKNALRCHSIGIWRRALIGCAFLNRMDAHSFGLLRQQQ